MEGRPERVAKQGAAAAATRRPCEGGLRYDASAILRRGSAALIIALFASIRSLSDPVKAELRGRLPGKCRCVGEYHGDRLDPPPLCRGVRGHGTALRA